MGKREGEREKEREECLCVCVCVSVGVCVLERWGKRISKRESEMGKNASMVRWRGIFFSRSGSPVAASAASAPPPCASPSSRLQAPRL